MDLWGIDHIQEAKWAHVMKSQPTPLFGRFSTERGLISRGISQHAPSTSLCSGCFLCLYRIWKKGHLFAQRLLPRITLTHFKKSILLVPLNLRRKRTWLLYVSLCLMKHLLSCVLEVCLFFCFNYCAISNFF